MGCFKPLTAIRLASGDISFSVHKSHGDSLKLPCGRCIGCRLDRSKAWAARCMHEASLYEDNCFITLTYNDEHLPSDGMLDYSHFQKFMKRLRKRFSGRNIRFYMCGEYGDLNARPHFHALLFNFDFPDRERFRRSGSGEFIDRSPVLEELWPFGISSVGNCTLQSAGYVARYVMKKRLGRDAKGINAVDKNTGEIVPFVPEFTKMSLKPGIGQGWFDKFWKDVYPQDAVIFEGGKRQRPPRFYDLKLEKMDPDLWESISQMRILKALEKADESQERLDVKEEVLRASIRKLTREV